MAFTDIYNTVLTPFLKKFKDAENEKVKKTILKNASEAVIKSRDTLEVKGDLPKDLEKVHFSFVLLFYFSISFSPTIGNRSLFQSLP
jgi:hypothetical protein